MPTYIYTGGGASAYAAAQAEEAKKIACKSIEGEFKASDATIEEKHTYAECIETLYPELTGDDLLAIKILIFIGIVAAIITFIKVKMNWGDNFESFLGALLALVFAPFTAGLLFILIYYLTL